jgi:hypothetical protein
VLFSFVWDSPFSRLRHSIVDVKLSNTFMGAQHLPPSAVGVLTRFGARDPSVLRLVSRHLAFSRNEILTVYITCLFSTLVPGTAARLFSSRSCSHRSIMQRLRTNGWTSGMSTCRRG